MAVVDHHRHNYLHLLHNRLSFASNFIIVLLLGVISRSTASSSSSISPNIPRRGIFSISPLRTLKPEPFCRRVLDGEGGSAFRSVPIICTEDNDCPSPRCQCLGKFDTYYTDGARLNIIYGFQTSMNNDYGVGVCGSAASGTQAVIGRDVPPPSAPHHALSTRHRRDRRAWEIPLECMKGMRGVGDVLMPISCWDDSDCPNNLPTSTGCQCNGQRDEPHGGFLLYGYYFKEDLENIRRGQGFCGSVVPRRQPNWQQRILLRSISPLHISPQYTSPLQPQPLPQAASQPSLTVRHLATAPSNELHPRAQGIPPQCMNELVLPTTGMIILRPISCWDDDDCVRERRGNPYKCQCNGGYDEDFGGAIRYGYLMILGHGAHPYPYGVGLCGAVITRGRPIG
ncbi:MAG: hypothetical protein M1812_007401 [Candelaria pacifica]|nr:MAG: hypothetical protein M1812_007401 [Candelaria pacifica]